MKKKDKMPVLKHFKSGNSVSWLGGIIVFSCVLVLVESYPIILFQRLQIVAVLYKVPF